MKRKVDILGQRVAPYLFILPAVLFFLTFMLYPIIASLQMSFQPSLHDFSFSLVNYKRMLGDKLVLTAMLNTFQILIVQVPVMLFLALILASILNSQVLLMKDFFRSVLFLPAITSLIAYSILFKILFMETGLINQALEHLNFIKEPILFLREALPAKMTIILAMLWRWTGYNMILFLAGLQSISPSIYEAAAIDGSGPIRNFFQLTLPQLKPVILFASILSTIGTLQLFDEPYILTLGGPANKTLSLALYLYRTGFGNSEFPYASALAYLVVVLIAMLSWLQFKATGKE